MSTKSEHASDTPRLYEGEADLLMDSAQFPDRVSLLPSGSAGPGAGARPGSAGAGGAGGAGGGGGGGLRIMWGQDMLRDMVDGRYRSVVCGVNDHDNSHGIIAQLVGLIASSQWTAHGVTSYARMFQDAVSIHAAQDREPYVLKYDLDSLLILALLRPKGRDFFTLEDLGRGFATVAKMLRGRRERLPVATVSFLGARSNRLVASAADQGAEPSFERVLDTMYQAGFRGDVYPSPAMWRSGHIGVFPSYPFPEGLHRMRQGSS